jgi:hypothetical protein
LETKGALPEGKSESDPGRVHGIDLAAFNPELFTLHAVAHERQGEATEVEPFTRPVRRFHFAQGRLRTEPAAEIPSLARDHEKIAGRKNLYFNPRPRNRSPWDKYREAWCQMACPSEENCPSKIVATRCRDQQPDPTLTCPLKQLM